MSTHTHPETRHASPAEPAVERDSDSPSNDGTTSDPSYDAAATFDTGSTVRLPNTVDGENKRVG